MCILFLPVCAITILFILLQYHIQGTAINYLLIIIIYNNNVVQIYDERTKCLRMYLHTIYLHLQVRMFSKDILRKRHKLSRYFYKITVILRIFKSYTKENNSSTQKMPRK